MEGIFHGMAAGSPVLSVSQSGAFRDSNPLCWLVDGPCPCTELAAVVVQQGTLNRGLCSDYAGDLGHQ